MPGFGTGKNLCCLVRFSPAKWYLTVRVWFDELPGAALAGANSWQKLGAGMSCWRPDLGHLVIFEYPTQGRYSGFGDKG